MTKNDTNGELDEKLRFLEENFLREIRKIAEQRLKLERQVASSSLVHVAESPLERRFESEIVRENFTVRLEQSLDGKLAKTRGTSDELEDRLLETRITFEDKQRMVVRAKAELERREKLLINSVHQIEVYLRAVFYLKQDADRMCGLLRKSEDEQRKMLRRLEQENRALRGKKESLSKAVRAFEPAKLHLQELISGSSEYLNIDHLVEYYLVLKLFQEELLAEESQQELLVRRQRTDDERRGLSAALLLQEDVLLRLKSQLKNLRVQVTELEEQIDATIIGRVKDDAARFDLHQWIQKLYSTSIEYRPPEKEAVDPLDQMAGIRDFVSDAFIIVERLKSK